MKSVEFGEDQLGHLQDLSEELFGDSEDPRSYAYKRILIRPQLNWSRIILNCICPLIVMVCLFSILIFLGIYPHTSFIVSHLCLFLYFVVNTKKILICLIHVYQRYAPDSIRNKCRFEPSCSQYMITALQQYGLGKGLKKGINRLRRCNINGGGYDLP